MCQTLHQLLVQASETHHDRTAVVCPDATLTYSELFRAAERLAQSLVQAGIAPGDRVGLCMPKTCDAIVALYGILLSGAAYVPIDPTSPAERSLQIALNVETRALVATPDKATTLGPVIAAKLEHLDVFVNDSSMPASLPGCSVHSWTPSPGEPASLPDVNENELAYILHTSGSTGRPKGVAISHKSALTFVDMAAEFFSVSPDDRLCSLAPLHFDLSVFDLYVACRQGACLVLMPEYYSAFPKKFVSSIREHRVTVWNSVSSALTLLIDKGQPDSDSLDSVRLVIFSGESMSATTLRQLRECFKRADLYNGYGQTEANTSMYFRIGSIPSAKWRVPIGKAFPNYDVFAVDQSGVEIDRPGIEGELLVCSDAVADGYWGNRELTESRFRFDADDGRISSRIFRTGDTVRLNADHDFEFVGRTDNMIKSRGYRIELSEIEHALHSYPGVSEAVCVAIPDDKVSNRLFGFVSASKNGECIESELLKYLHSQLPAYMVPERIVIREALPRTSTGKLDRDGLATELRAILGNQA